MRTTLNLDDGAVNEAMAVSPGRTKTAVINEALREYARRRRLERFRSLRGKFEWQGDLAELRQRRPAR
jgi:Arc/MetJ family transcription regulator